MPGDNLAQLLAREWCGFALGFLLDFFPVRFHTPNYMSSEDIVHLVEADEASAGERLDVLLSRSLAEMGLSRSRIQALIKSGAVCIADDGTVLTNASMKVKPGVRVVVRVPPSAPSRIAAAHIPLDILHEDEDLLVLNKPAGRVIHPAPGHFDDTIVNALLAHCGSTLSGVGGVARPGIVHRLDKDTSGLVVVAKNDFAHQHLAAQFAAHGRDGALEREYIAFIWGLPIPSAGRIDVPIARTNAQGGKGSSRTRLRMRAGNQQKGKQAITHYRVTREYGNGTQEGTIVSRLVCRLETGRTHQIRVHLSHLGHPLLGDQLYGAGFKTRAQRLPLQAHEIAGALQRQALHAWKLGFRHPRDEQHLCFESSLPDDLAQLETVLGVVAS